MDNKERSEEITGKSAQRLIPFLSENAAWSFHGKPTIPAEEIRVATSAREESSLLEEENLPALKFIGLWTQKNASFAFIRRAGPTNRLIQ